MKTAFYSFEQNQRHYIVSSANLHGRWSATGGAWRRRIDLSVVKSRYSYFVPEVQARLKAVSIIFYWERGYIKRPAVSIEVSSKVEELLLDERHDRKPRRPARKCETRNVDLSEDILGCPSCCQKTRCRWVGPNSYGMFSLWLTTILPFLLPRRSISNFSCSLTRNITPDGMLIAHSDERWFIYLYQFSLPQSLNYTFLLKGWENVTFDLGNERLI